ncbi:MAG: hypothetical protein VKL39_05650 [Leptolyngbyaceae bacterium]|nr:hypothetical protein [Leptolyngbyaceae bacterium]
MSIAYGEDRFPITTLFLELSVSFTASHQPLRERIEAALKAHGEPLRWAITAVDLDKQSLRVEAVVIHDAVGP